MPTKSQSVTKYFIINGWLIIALILVFSWLHATGVTDHLHQTSTECMLGDGFLCISYIAETNDTNNADGDEKDNVSIFFKNTLSETAYNISIILRECKAPEQMLMTLAPGEESSYIVYDCRGLKANSKFKSELDLRYTTLNNEKILMHLNKGHIVSHVSSPKPENIIDRTISGIKDWIRRNVG